MAEKAAWETAVGEVNVPPESPDSLLGDKVSERKRRQIERQEEIDEAKHKSAVAKLKNEEATAKVAVEKAGEPKEAASGFKVTGGLDLGNINPTALLTKQIEDRDALRIQAEQAAANQQQISNDLREKLHLAEMNVMQTGLQAQLQTLNQAVQDNASRGSFMDNYNSIIETAKSLGLGRAETSDLDTTLAIKKMEFEQSVELKRMSREEKRADREFQRQLNKDVLEREDKKIEREQADKRFEMLANAPKVVGAALAQGFMASGANGGEVTEQAGTGKQGGQHIEAGIGEALEGDCPNCEKPIAIGPTARQAECANCGFKVPIKRTKAPA